MRALLIDDAAKAKVARVVAHAMSHIYVPRRSPIPGDDPNFVVNLDTYRCVFTFTRIDGKLYRHLTISIPRPNIYPNPIAAFHIAVLFGFTGYNENDPEKPGVDWMMDVKRDENAVMLVQEASFDANRVYHIKPANPQ